MSVTPVKHEEVTFSVSSHHEKLSKGFQLALRIVANRNEIPQTFRSKKRKGGRHEI